LDLIRTAAVLMASILLIMYWRSQPGISDTCTWFKSAKVDGLSRREAFEKPSNTGMYSRSQPGISDTCT
jgi:hypothetical protein